VVSTGSVGPVSSGTDDSNGHAHKIKDKGNSQNSFLNAKQILQKIRFLQLPAIPL